MSEHSQFTIELEQLEGYEFRVKFDLEQAVDLLTDEPPPLGGAKGPNPSRLLAAAAANCLSASLLFCVTKNEPPTGAIKTHATCSLERNQSGKLRVARIDARLMVDGELEQAVRMKRCLDLFEDFCVVTASLREGFPVGVEVVSQQGETLHRTEA